MVAKIIDGKALAITIRRHIATELAAKITQGFTPPTLAVILVGNDPASHIYVRNKRQACDEVGIRSIYHALPESVEESALLSLIQTLNQDHTVNGILLQLPLPDHIDTDKLLELIDPNKDVDGFHPYNLGRLAQRRPALRPCTPYGVMMLLDSIQQPYHDRHAVIIGASNIVGRPMALELLHAGCTITVCHSLTKDLGHHIKQADIVVSATGTPHLIKANWIKPHSTVIDVGIHRLANGTLIGDVEFELAKEKAAWITPVPGGVGPMTIIALLKNTLAAAEKQNKM